MSKVYIIEHEIISPIAVGRDKVIESIENNFTADRLLKGVDVRGIPFKKGAEIQEDLSSYYDQEDQELQKICKIDRKFELIVACYGRAKNRMQELLELVEPKRTGVIMGIGADAAPFANYEQEMLHFMRQGQNPFYELFASYNKEAPGLNMMNNAYDIYSMFLAQKFNAQAFQKTVLTACVSSTQAIAQAFDSISRGKTDMVVAGGTDSIINFLGIVSFGKLGVIQETEEAISCTPFDQNRYGALAGEAAGFAVMVSEDFIKKHQIEPIAEVVGYGNTLDAFKITAPDPSGEAMAMAISNALNSAGISPTDIDYINAHGTGTKQNDATELLAIRKALGDEAHRIPISTTKDRHGHAIAAAGIQEVSILLELMQAGIMPGNLHMKNPIKEDMNLLRENVNSEIRYALSSNFAFGGINTVLVLKKID